MDQMTFSEAECQTKKRTTRREIFLERMDKLVPWKRLEKKVGRQYSLMARPVRHLARCPQCSAYNLSGSAMEDVLYEIESMRHFADLKLDRLPDEMTILKFRRFLDRHGLVLR